MCFSNKFKVFLNMSNNIKNLAIFAIAFFASVLPLSVSAAGKTVGEHLKDHGVTELSNFFVFATVAAAFVGFIIVILCLSGMATIKLAANSPMGQKAESIGMMNFGLGTVIGGAMGVAGTIFYFLVASAAGSDADTSAFDKLKSSSIEHSQVNDSIARMDHNFIIVNTRV